jgi:hypothetical protein
VKSELTFFPQTESALLRDAWYQRRVV